MVDCRFDLKNANINDVNCEKMKAENLPDVVRVLSFLNATHICISLFVASLMLQSGYNVEITCLSLSCRKFSRYLILDRNVQKISNSLGITMD